ncbi:MAG: hypothetical protein HQK79_10910 [Desulfobacterales bacterium]|nr:hypothetical protein [Desulfobacterales bacterium]MBF0395819.1 hypothetical protein [Desulfobacterales bacterium]
MDLTFKQKQFNAAMDLYNSRKIYKLFGIVVSITNISMQIYLLSKVIPLSIGIAQQIGALIVAFILTDFINGLIHMYMDINEDYESIAGPLIANFHLHHKNPQYKRNPLAIVYFNESGSKVWLAGYLIIVLFLCNAFMLNSIVLYSLLYIAILSSVAEVSHYLCHSSNSIVAIFLARIGLLLPKRHHAKHHLQDNMNYAFLNGVTDPLINLIAKKYSKGYKNNTDMHYANYKALNTDGR